MLDKIAVIGYSGHAYVIIEAVQASNGTMKGYCNPVELTDNPYQLEYLGNEQDEGFDVDKNCQFIIAVGDNKLRERILKRVNPTINFTNVIHPNSQISFTLKMGVGNFFSANAVVNALVNIGNHCILNTGCIIEHECTIADFVHIGPGAVLAGSVSIGRGTFVGANSVIKQGVKIGSNVIIGAGSVIIKDVSDNVIMVGNPAKLLKKHE